MDQRYYVYIMTNRYNTVVYVGMTNDLPKRMQQHKEGRGSGFTSRYRIMKLVYYEVFDDAYTAIAREKQLKAGSRQKKLDVIENMNREWRDLSQDW